MRVCVIGAGPSGLTTIKQLRDEEHEVVCFEHSADIGGVWYRHDGDEEEMKVYDDLILTISMRLMCFSDFMVKGRRFAHHREYLQYLHGYADRFRLREHIAFHSRVQHVRKGEGTWHVTVSSEGKTVDHTFDAVAVCAGPFQRPEMGVAHLEKFTGEVVHSSRYRNNERYRDKRVLIVGLAESGADLLREISDVSAACTLSIRSRSFLIPRLCNGRFSTDSLTHRRLHYEFFVRATDLPFPMESIFEDQGVSRSEFLEATRLSGMMTLAARALERHSRSREDEDPHALNGLGQPLYPLKVDLFTEESQAVNDFINDWNRKSHHGLGNYSEKNIACKNVSFVPNVLAGKIVVNDAGIADIHERVVRFGDGTSSEFDCIVLCTGFRRDFSALGDLHARDNNVRNLYKHAFHPDCDGRLALIGYVRPYTGGIPICAEMQARYFAQLCSGKIRLPRDVKDRIEREKKWEEAWTELSPRHTEAIPAQTLFCDSLAAEMNCLPRASELVKDPALLSRLWFYTFNQASYRLVGPHSDYDAAYRELMEEDLPGRSEHLLGLSIAMSTWPSHRHDKDNDGVAFPFRLKADEEVEIRQVLSATAAKHVKHSVPGEPADA